MRIRTRPVRLSAKSMFSQSRRAKLVSVRDDRIDSRNKGRRTRQRQNEIHEAKKSC